MPVERKLPRADVVEEDGTTNTYTELTGSTFKEIYYGHTSELKWRIIDRGEKFNPSTRKCNLCLKEKYHIIFQPSGGKPEQKIRAVFNMQTSMAAASRKCVKG